MNEHAKISDPGGPSVKEPAPRRIFPREVRNAWRWASVGLPDTSGILFRHKMTSLRVMELLQHDENGEVNRPSVEQQIARLKDEACRDGARHEWSAASEIEQLLIGLMDRDTMRVEMRRYLADARRIGLSNIAEFEDLAKETLEDVAKYRTTLMRLAAEVQQRFRKLHIYREYVAAYTARVSLLFFFSAMVFVGLLFAVTYAENQVMGQATAPTVIGPRAPSELGWIRSLTPVALSLAAGVFGAAFSMMAQTRKRIEISTLEDMRTNARMVMLLFRLCVGFGAAMIAFYVFHSGMLGDSANFPNPQLARIERATIGLSESTAVTVLTPNENLSLLMVWSFVAGFSEFLVPSILRKAEGTIGDMKL